ncbi:MAG: ABC transporter permease, partial [Microbacteriaceae bacterium]|nr:ABC transporter permease [Microbacteriaceae bacterium]
MTRPTTRPVLAGTTPGRIDEDGSAAPATPAPAPARRLRPGVAGASTGLGTVAVGALAAVGLWWLFTAIAGAGNPILAAMQPDRVPAAFAALVERGTLVPDTVASVRRLVTGLLLAIVAGVGIGLAIGASRTAALAASPAIQFLRVVSPLAWAPVAVALFGVGDAPVAFLVAAAAVWPVALSTAAGVKAVDPELLQVARTLGATERERLRWIVLPSIRPQIATGIRQAIGVSWVVLVPAEMIGVSSGLGYQILNARDRFAYDEMLVVILVIGAIGLLLDG